MKTVVRALAMFAVVPTLLLCACTGNPDREPGGLPSPGVPASGDSDGDGWLEACATPIADPRTSAELEGFDARLFGEGFELLSAAFGPACRGANGKVLHSTWNYESTGQVVTLFQRETPDASAPEITPWSILFSDGGYSFQVNHTDGDPSNSLRPDLAHEVVFDAALNQIAPDLRKECFYRTGMHDWDDLAEFGVGDPRPVIPAGYTNIRLEFLAMEQPAADCPPGPAPTERPAYTFSAMFSDGSHRLLSLHFAAKIASGIYVAAFSPGSARWSNADTHFSMNWAPEAVDDEAARRIARALDPGFDAVCSVNSRAIDAAELEGLGFRIPSVPDGFRMEGDPGTRAFVVESGPACAAPQPPGVFAEWLLLQPANGGVIHISVTRGQQDAQFMPNRYDASYAIHWRGADGSEFQVAGLKAPFERSVLFEFARDIDPSFDESKLTDPPVP